MTIDVMRMLLKEKDGCRSLLFPRGYLLTTSTDLDINSHPFYGMWKKTEIGQYTAFVHPKQKIHINSTEKLTFLLIGHAYNPLSGDVLETALLEKAAKLYSQNEDYFAEYFNQWTGLFNLFIIEKSKIRLYGDPTGMYMAFYGRHNGQQYCASHSGLLGDVCGATIDPYVKRLVNYRYYSLFGKALPGDLSPYKEFKRLIPNHYALCEDGEWIIKRFYPAENNALYELSYEEIIDQAAKILHDSMQIIHKKWNRAAISLTGGCDSKTTLACTNGAYDRYSYFSYVSQDSEGVDAVAAAKICEQLGITHTNYEIPEEVGPDHELLRVIMEHNSGDIGGSNENDVRKRAFFLCIDDFDVEIKSWVSEIARAYYHKRFATKRFPKKLTPRYATSLYKVFVTDRRLVRDTDKVFEEFLDKYYLDGSFELVPWYDLFFWEFRMSSWNGLVITGEQQIAYDITIPYNNRVLLQLLLSTPVEKRIKDEPHWDIMRKMNPIIANSGISVTNIKHTKNRARMEKLYLEISTIVPF